MTITETTTNTTGLADAILRAKEAAEQAQEALDNLKAEFIDACETMGLEELVARDGTRVVLERRDRTSYDYDYVAERTAPAVMAVVTTTRIDAKRIRAAVDLGLVPSEVMDGAAQVTEVKQVRTYSA
jgi:hypothetical protein